jgi:hypothetical protein
MTAAEIARFAGVTRATVSNWRRRHPDFPSPTGGTEASPAYDLDAVRAWLAGRGQLPVASAADDLRTALRARPRAGAASGRLFALILAADRLAADDLAALTELPVNRLPQWVQDVARPYTNDIPGADDLEYRPDEAPLLRAILRCVREEGAVMATDVLAERGPDDAGTYQTPAPLVELMVDLLAVPDEPFPASVFDPACGTGSLLAAAARRGASEMYGQDAVAAQAAQAAVRLRVSTDTAKIRVCEGDSIRADAFPDLAVHAALCNPPYGNREWGHEELAFDPRWAYGLPPKGESELAWIQHCLAHLLPGAPAVVLMPPAAAERAAGRRIRAELVRSGALRAVVALPAGAAAPYHIGLHLWLLRRPNSPTVDQHVLFVDTAKRDPAVASQAARRADLDWSSIRAAVLDPWKTFAMDAGGFDLDSGAARAVAVIDLLDESVDLTPIRHVIAASTATEPDHHAEDARALRARLRRAAAGLAALSGGDSWRPAGPERRSWRSAAVADLLRGGALTLLRAPAVPRSSDAGGVARAGEAGTGPRTLTARDVVTNCPASGPTDDKLSGVEIEIRPGDVILPEVLRAGRGTARVADARDAGQHLGKHLYLFRPDPQRLDPWFLAGFLSAEDNVNAAATGTSIVRLDARRLRVPLLPLDEQRRYGTAFRQLHAVRSAADIASRLADETVRTLGSGLTYGALLPPRGDPPPS